MRRTRPPHLQARGVQSFGEDIVLIRVESTRNSFGEAQLTEISTPIRAASAPPGTDALERSITEGGVRLEGARLFWTDQEIVPSGPDFDSEIIVWQGTRFIVRSVQPWGSDLWEVLGIREEPQ